MVFRFNPFLVLLNAASQADALKFAELPVKKPCEWKRYIPFIFCKVFLNLIKKIIFL